MLNIYICDDNRELLAQFETIVRDYILMKSYDIGRVYAAATPEEILQASGAAPSPAVGLYFLDVELKNRMDGIGLACRLRRQDPRGFVVFITDYRERAADVFRYHLEAFDYILKNQPTQLKARIEETITLVYARYRQQCDEPEEFLRIRCGEREHFIKHREICYICTAGTAHQLKLVTETKMFTFRGELNKLAPHLGPQFFRNDKSCLVNLAHVSALDQTARQVILDNGESRAFSLRAWGRLQQYLKTDNNGTVSHRL